MINFLMSYLYIQYIPFILPNISENTAPSVHHTSQFVFSGSVYIIQFNNFLPTYLITGYYESIIIIYNTRYINN